MAEYLLLKITTLKVSIVLSLNDSNLSFPQGLSKTVIGGGVMGEGAGTCTEVLRWEHRAC